MNVEAFYAPWETPVSSFEEIEQTLRGLFERWVSVHGRLFAWRGVVDARWPLHSSLYRRLLWSTSGTKAPDEKALLAAEGEVLANVHRWGLHDGDRGRLSILGQLATLQHFGVPTRLLDVTLNAYIGLWFAVQPTFVDGLPVEDEIDGRLFAIDVTNRPINEDEGKRDWEDSLRRPWNDDDDDWQKEWCKGTWAWRPPSFERRIAAQNGAFLFGGVPRVGLGKRGRRGRTLRAVHGGRMRSAAASRCRYDSTWLGLPAVASPLLAANRPTPFALRRRPSGRYGSVSARSSVTSTLRSTRTTQASRNSHRPICAPVPDAPPEAALSSTGWWIGKRHPLSGMARNKRRRIVAPASE